jgi:hypothetical protein
MMTMTQGQLRQAIRASFFNRKASAVVLAEGDNLALDFGFRSLADVVAAYETARPAIRAMHGTRAALFCDILDLVKGN